MRQQHLFTEYVAERFSDKFWNVVEMFMQEDVEKANLPLDQVHNIGNWELTEVEVKAVFTNDLPEMVMQFDVLVEAKVYVCDSDHHYDRNKTTGQCFMIRCQGDLGKRLDDFSIIAPVEVYSDKYKQRSPMSDALVPVIYPANLDNIANDFL